MSQVNRGRDVLDLMNKKGELGMREAIVRIAEDNTMMHAELNEMRLVVKKIIEQLALQIKVMGEHNVLMAKMERKFYPDNEANPNQKWSK